MKPPFSLFTKHNGLVYVSGQIPYRQDGTKVEGGIEEQTHQVMKNLQTVLEMAESDLSKVIKTEIFLVDMDDYEKVNEVYRTYFQEKFPARVTIQVAGLPLGAEIEIAVIAKE